jgi:hypothetical protein
MVVLANYFLTAFLMTSSEVKRELPETLLRTKGDCAFKVTGQLVFVKSEERFEIDQFVYATGADALGEYGPVNTLDHPLRKRVGACL